MAETLNWDLFQFSKFFRVGRFADLIAQRGPVLLAAEVSVEAGSEAVVMTLMGAPKGLPATKERLALNSPRPREFKRNDPCLMESSIRLLDFCDSFGAGEKRDLRLQASSILCSLSGDGLNDIDGRLWDSRTPQYFQSALLDLQTFVPPSERYSLFLPLGRYPLVLDRLRAFQRQNWTRGISTDDFLQLQSITKDFKAAAEEYSSSL